MAISFVSCFAKRTVQTECDWQNVTKERSTLQIECCHACGKMCAKCAKLECLGEASEHIVFVL